MKRAVLFAITLAACQPDFEFDLSGLDPGPITGDQGVVTFALVDGCPDSNWLFGCPKEMPPLATGARARFVIGSVSGDPRAEDIIDQATFVVSDSHVLAVARDADGFLVMQALAPGVATVELHKKKNGDLIDSIAVHVEPIRELRGDDQTTLLAGARIAAHVTATGTSGPDLFARGAITVTLSNGLALDPDDSGFFSSSEQVAVRAMTSGDATIRFSAGDVSIDVPYKVVGRADITEASVSDLFPEAGATKHTLVALTKFGDKGVRGGPACDWRIVSGGGPGAALATGSADDTRDSLFTFYDSAIVYGEGDTTIECRVNDQAIAQTTIHLGP